ncbi:DMSO/TMAO reductase YedYZ heme-binding membrane subunit [Thermocatellispora tengchongensis]|uniref:DMSO/TMAO reductase YedYZ heme-binding membrane subunit n=1 Tax=Thermocatellispora tengchongensis TaxID=1073253 RepID=A0A840PKQ2_9ACTN|nr:hypothetical protein [Thermocatellispora tengchongensis]MBB5140098.1 DMSO/TMAO reductase YedYZ heme-binding membrane subunit [Thermocatellispora tengchongensis]
MKSRRAPSYKRRPNTNLWLIAMGVILTGALTFAIVSLLTGWGAQAVASARAFLEFYVGVFALVSFTLTCVLGVAATERMILKIEHRILAQRVHRAVATLGIGFLLTHILLKVDGGRIGAAGAVIPFAGGVGLWASVGAIAGDLMLLVFVTGIIRGRFARSTKPWVWRALHDVAYLAWPVSILHGLLAGRPPANWVVWCYALSLVAVGIALAIRLISTAGTRETAETPRIEVAKRPAEPVARVFTLRSVDDLQRRKTG